MFERCNHEYLYMFGSARWSGLSVDSDRSRRGCLVFWASLWFPHRRHCCLLLSPGCVVVVTLHCEVRMSGTGPVYGVDASAVSCLAVPAVLFAYSPADIFDLSHNGRDLLICDNNKPNSGGTDNGTHT